MVISALVACASGLGAAPARADGVEEAKKHSKLAVQLSQSNRHEAAICQLRIAWAAAPQPDILFNLGRENAALGKKEEAIDFFLRYLRAHRNAPDEKSVLELVEQLGGAVHVPPMEIPKISRFSVAVDPQMATIAVFKWLDREERPLQLDAPGHVGWHELLAADWEQAWSFYGQLFSWQKADAENGIAGTYQLFSAGGQTIGGMVTKPPTVPVPFWLYYFNVADIDVAMKRVRSNGGRILNGPIELPGDRWIAQCTDPQDAIFALIGKRKHSGIGYFGPAAHGERSYLRVDLRK